MRPLSGVSALFERLPSAVAHPNLRDFVTCKYSVARCSKTLEWFSFSQKRRTALTFCFTQFRTENRFALFLELL